MCYNINEYRGQRTLVFYFYPIYNEIYLFFLGQLQETLPSPVYALLLQNLDSGFEITPPQVSKDQFLQRTSLLTELAI